MVVLDFYLVAKYGNTLDDGLNELVFLDGIPEVPDGVEVRKGFADLFRGEVATVLSSSFASERIPKKTSGLDSMTLMSSRTIRSSSFSGMLRRGHVCLTLLLSASQMR